MLVVELRIRYCHIGSQWGRVPTHVLARRPGNERGVGGGGAKPNMDVM
jgi:hypothetical protein